MTASQASPDRVAVRCRSPRRRGPQLLVLVLLVLAGCGGSSATHTARPTAPSATAPTVGPARTPGLSRHARVGAVGASTGILAAVAQDIQTMCAAAARSGTINPLGLGTKVHELLVAYQAAPGARGARRLVKATQRRLRAGCAPQYAAPLGSALRRRR